MTRRQRLQHAMEMQWRIITYYNAVINYRLKKGTTLMRPELVMLRDKQDKHIIRLMNLKETFEKMTGESIIFWGHVKYYSI